MDRDTKEGLLGCTLVVIGFPVLMFITALLKAFVARQLWIWFIQPTFLLAPPSYGVMYGLALFVGALWPAHPVPKETEDHWWLPFVGYPLTLFVGFITHWLVVR